MSGNVNELLVLLQSIIIWGSLISAIVFAAYYMLKIVWRRDFNVKNWIAAVYCILYFFVFGYVQTNKPFDIQFFFGFGFIVILVAVLEIKRFGPFPWQRSGGRV